MFILLHKTRPSQTRVRFGLLYRTGIDRTMPTTIVTARDGAQNYSTGLWDRAGKSRGRAKIRAVRL